MHKKMTDTITCKSSGRRTAPVAVLKLYGRKSGKTGKRCVAALTAFLLAAVFVLAAMPPVMSQASSCKLIFSVSDTEVRVDDSLTVELTLDGDVVPGIFEGYISYDPNVLEYVSGPECVAGGEGTLRISDMGYESNTLSRKYTLSFKAYRIGSTDIAMRGKPEIYEADLGYSMSVSSNKVSVTVKPANLASSDASLAVVRINPGTLDPAFSSSVYEYSVKVANEVTELYISAQPNDSGASVKIEGNTNLAVGQNRILLIVTAEDGTVGKYVIYAVREEAGEALPTDVEQNDGTGENDPGNQNNNGGSDNGVPSGWAFYATEEEQGVYLTADARYKVCKSLGDLELPAGYGKTSIMISGNTVTAYVPTNNPSSDYLLLVLEREGSAPALYSFDRVEKTIQRFDSDAMGSGNKTASGYSTIEEQELVKSYEKNLGTMTMVIAILSGVCMLLLIIVIRMALRRRNELD